MPDKHAEIEAALLKLLYVRPLAIQDITNPPSTQMVRDAYPTHAAFLTNDNWESVNQAVWALVRRGLAWINMGSMHSTGLWRIILTEKGRLAACGEAVTPEDPTGYMERLLRDVPGTSDVVKLYLNEALSSYVEGCYLASTVMLGVAAEACMLDTAETYVNWAGKRAEKLREHLENSRTFYVAKLQEFQKRLRRGWSAEACIGQPKVSPAAVYSRKRMARPKPALLGFPTKLQSSSSINWADPEGTGNRAESAAPWATP